jgi:hypothetical protein
MVQVPTAATAEELHDALAALERAYREDPRADLSL